MKKLLFFLFIIGFIPSPIDVYEGHHHETPSDIRVLKKAYKYRTDIDKEVLKKTYLWPEKVGVLHSDWIENRNGKSMDLQGNVLFPQYDYTRLTKVCGDYWVMVVNGKSGLLDKNGKLLADFKYSYFDFYNIDKGIIVAVGDDDTNPDIIRTEDKASFAQLCALDTVDFHNNAWVDRFAYYYNKKNYRKAVFCIEYYDVYERSVNRVDQDLAYYQSVRYYLLAHEMNKNYQGVIDIIQSNLLPGFSYDSQTKELAFDSDNNHNASQLSEIETEIQYINLNFSKTKRLYKEQIEARQRAAEAALLLAAATAVAVTTAAVEYQQQQATNQTPSSAAASSSTKKNDQEGNNSNNNNSNSNNNNDDDSGRIEYYEWQCAHCKGTGEVIYEDDITGHMGLPAPEYVICEKCGKKYAKNYLIHKHKQCSHCHGKGKHRARYKN